MTLPSVFYVNRSAQAPSESSCITTSNTVTSLCGQLTDAEHNVGAVTAALDQTGQANAKLSAEVAALRAELQKTKTALAAAETKVGKLTTEMSAATKAAAAEAKQQRDIIAEKTSDSASTMANAKLVRSDDDIM